MELSSLKVDGGASANDFLMQTQADVINAAGETSGVCGDYSDGSSVSGRTGSGLLEE